MAPLDDVHGVRALVLDAVGTLIVPDPPPADVYRTVGRRFGSRLEGDVIRSAYRQAFQLEEARDRARGGRTNPEREQTRWRNIVAAALPDVADPLACFTELWRHFAEPASWRVVADRAVLLREAQSRGWRVGVASNFDERLRRVLKGRPELPSDLAIVISAEVGWRKPAPEFFAAVAEALATPPNAILMLGDDPVNDRDGAIAAGMQARLVPPS